MPKQNRFDYDLIVIGSGAGGSITATMVAEAGQRVALIEADTFGGESPNWGDIPLNALLNTANLYDQLKHGDKIGIRSSTISYNYPSIRAWKDLVVSRTGAGGNRRYYESRNISVFNGLARFIAPNEITVNRRHLSARYFLIATGSTWEIPNIPGLEDINHHTPKTILDIIRPPKSLAIIGGNETSLELAQLFATFGTKVYLIDNNKRLLPLFDQEVGSLLIKTMSEQKGVVFLNNSKLVSIAKDQLAKRLLLDRGGVNRSLKVDEILIADQRIPVTDLGLENAGIKYNKNGIKVNQFLQTNLPHIYASGGVTGHNNYTHTALLESRVVANNILNRNKSYLDYTIMPRFILSQPTIVSVGVTEQEAQKRRITIRTALAPLNTITRSNTANYAVGFVKLITNSRGIIIGGTVATPEAREVAQELIIAIRQKMTAHDLATTPHIFLSWNEALRVTASKLS